MTGGRLAWFAFALLIVTPFVLGRIVHPLWVRAGKPAYGWLANLERLRRDCADEEP